MQNSNSITGRLLGLTFCFILFSLFTALTQMMVLWFLLVLIVSVIFISKNKKAITKKDFAVALVLSAVPILSNAFMGLFIIPSYLASVAILKNSDNEIALYHRAKKREAGWTFLCIGFLGGILAILNIALSFGSYTIQLGFQPSFLIDALRAGIFEEIFFRMFLFSICVKVTGAVAFTKTQECLCYLIMVLPHVLLHFSSGIDIVSIVILSVLFGLPFALMQRKVNLLSAIGAHSVVDLIRFIVLGV